MEAVSGCRDLLEGNLLKDRCHAVSGGGAIHLGWRLKSKSCGAIATISPSHRQACVRSFAFGPVSRQARGRIHKGGVGNGCPWQSLSWPRSP